MSWRALDARVWVGVSALLVVAGAWATLGIFLSQEREIQEAKAVTGRLSRAVKEEVIRTIKGADEAVPALGAEFQRKGAPGASFSGLAEHPLTVSVAMPEEQALAGFRERGRQYYLAATLLSALVLGLSALLVRAFSRQIEIARMLRERDAQRAEAEESLRESEARFRTIFEKAPTAIVVAASEGTIIDANPAYLRLFGFASVDEARCIDALELYVPPQRREVAAFHERWRNGDIAERRWERTRERRDGSSFHADVRVVPMHFPGGMVRVGFAVDITERKRVQEELERAKDRLDLAVHGAQLAVVDIDCATRIATVNDQCGAIRGAKSGEYQLSLRDLEDLIHPEDKPRVRGEFVDVLKGRKPRYVAHHRVRDANGSWKWLSWRASVVERDASGRALRVAGTAADVTAQRRTEEALRQTATKLSLVAANVPGMVFQMTYRAGQFFFHYVSPGSAELLGLAPETLRVNPGLFLQAIRENDRDRLEESLAVASVSLETWTWEGRASGPNGELRWIQVRATPTRAFFYGKVFWNGIAMDVTKIKENEQALQETKRLLRELSAHNEAVREEERARIARELHDELGQLLTGLKLSLSAMAGRDGSLEQKFDKAQNARVMHLVEQAIAVTRNAVTDLRPPALDHGLGAAVAWLADQFARRTGIACSVDLPEHEIELDEARATALFRILQESLTNVAKHAGAGSVHVRLSASRESIRLQVVDDGNGFGEKGAGTPRTFGLLGMRERVGMLGGSIHIASAPGGGTTVYVEITQARKAA